MVIERQRYLDKLINHMNNGLIKVITGIRRCGKSYLLFEIFYKYLLEHGVPKENIIAVPLDDEEYAEYTDPHKLNDYSHTLSQPVKIAALRMIKQIRRSTPQISKRRGHLQNDRL